MIIFVIQDELIFSKVSAAAIPAARESSEQASIMQALSNKS